MHYAIHGPAGKRTDAGARRVRILGATVELDAALTVWDGALCAQTDPEIFFPEKGQPGQQALGVCAACPVRDLCLATFGPITAYGVVGGTTAMQRRRKRPAAA